MGHTHSSKANWTRAEKRAIWKHLASTSGAGPRAQTVARQEYERILELDAEGRKDMRVRLGRRLPRRA